ncbi:hypothetical protein G7054_g6662 [Neopestalotiopsis clavispora]|nr:hypothetical protein G7054_g6662 [Neopestalotiopsis clavispora]
MDRIELKCAHCGQCTDFTISSAAQNVIEADEVPEDVQITESDQNVEEHPNDGQSAHLDSQVRGRHARSVGSHTEALVGTIVVAGPPISEQEGPAHHIADMRTEIGKEDLRLIKPTSYKYQDHIFLSYQGRST